MATYTKIMYQTEHGITPSQVSVSNAKDLTFPVNISDPILSYANNRFLVCRDSAGSVYESTDGINWSAKPAVDTSTAATLTPIVYGNNLYVTAYRSVSSNGAPVWYSSDLLTWTKAYLPSITTEPYDLTFGNGIFVAVNYNYVMYSTNGKNWNYTLLPLNEYDERFWSNIYYANGRYIVTGGSKMIATSTNLYSWGQVTPSARIYKVATNGKAFVGLCSDLNAVLYSTDGTNWTQHNLPSTSVPYDNLCFNGNHFVLTSYEGTTVAYSLNGQTWNSTNSPSSPSKAYLAGGNGTTISLPGSGTNYLRSTNTINWSNTYDSTDPITITSDHLPTLSADGYVFKGWALNNQPVQEGDTLAANSTNTFVAIWEKLPSKVYCGNSLNRATPISKIYCGDENNKARKIVKVYAGDENNKARLCWKN